MRLFLDTSVLLAAAGSARGASRFVIAQAAPHQWDVVSAEYCREEVHRNLRKLRIGAGLAWQQVGSRVRFVPTRVALDRPFVFSKLKDRPVVITALATRADWLLTLDEADFLQTLGVEVYGLRLATPGEFLLDQRARGFL